MDNFYRPLIYICLVSVFISCSDRKLKRQMEQFAAMEIAVPDEMRQMVRGRDSDVLNPASGLALMVIWVDSVACSSCRLSQISQYEDAIDFRKVVGERFMPLFVFSPQRSKVGELLKTLDITRLDYSVFIDENGLFPAANPHIPADSRFHTFLLDNNGKVILVGDPVNNPPLWELYKSTITTLIENDGVMPEPETKK